MGAVLESGALSQLTTISLRRNQIGDKGARALADALAAAGFNTVIVIERQNHLARLVSSFENRVRLCGNHQ